MTNELDAYDGVVERTPEGGVIRFERALPYDIRQVWDAITAPDRLAEWWMPMDADISVDLREGGEMVFEVGGDEPFTMRLAITRVEPPMLLEHEHVDDGSFTRWELEPTEAGCLLRLRHYVVDVPGAIERCYVVGLHTSLSRLGPAIEGAPVPWDWDEFAVSQAKYAERGLATPIDEDGVDKADEADEAAGKTDGEEEPA